MLKTMGPARPGGSGLERLVTWKTEGRKPQVQGLLRLQSEFSEPLSHKRSKGGWDIGHGRW